MWKRPEEFDQHSSGIHCGDRVAIIVEERRYHGDLIERMLVVIEATEESWRCDDPSYSGYGISDGVMWAMERDVVAAAATPKLPTYDLAQLERMAIEQALAKHEGNITHAARKLGVSVRTIQRKLKSDPSLWGDTTSHLIGR